MIFFPPNRTPVIAGWVFLGFSQERETWIPISSGKTSLVAQLKCIIQTCAKQ